MMNLTSNALKPFEFHEDARHRRVALPPSKELNRDNPSHPSQRRPSTNRRRRTRAVEPSMAWRPSEEPATIAAPAAHVSAAQPHDDIERDKLKLFPELAK
jgi:hypothetical protein